MKYLKNLSIFLQYNLFLHKIQKNCNKPTKMYDAKILHLSYKIQEMYDSVVSENSSMIVYCSNRNKTQRMCDESVDDCLEALKFVPDWFVTSKMLEKINNALLAHDDMFFFNKDFHKVTFITNQINVLAVDLNKINFGNDNNFDEDDSDTNIHARLLVWHSKYEKRQALKKDKQRINIYNMAS